MPHRLTSSSAGGRSLETAISPSRVMYKAAPFFADHSWNSDRSWRAATDPIRLVNFDRAVLASP